MSYLMLFLSIIIGLMPEAIFFAMFVIGAKGIKKGERRLPLVVFFIAAFLIIGLLLAYNIWEYVLLTVAMYIIMKLLHEKTEFIDLFLLTIPYLILAVIGFVCFGIGQLLPDSICPPLIMLIINRLLLLIIISALYPRLYRWYNTYKKVWNVHKDSKIKSITVRNISILVCNAIIIAVYTAIQLLGK